MKKFARGLSSTLLKLSLFTAATLASVLSILASPAPVKKALSDNQVYDGLVKSILESASKNLGEGGENAAPPDKQRSLDTLEVAAAQAFTPELLQSSAEQIFDSVFRWLNSDAPEPDFRIDLTQAKTNFITAAGAEVEKYVASLPVCTKEQLKTFDPEADPFSFTCRPSNVSAAAIREKAVNELSANKDFFPNPVLSAQNLPKNENGKTAFEQVEPLKNIYQKAKLLPWILLGVSILFGLVVFFLSETKRKGVKSLGLTFFGTGIFLLIGSWLGSFLLDQAFRPGGPLIKNMNNDLQEAGLAIARSSNNTFGRTVLIYSTVYLTIGAVTLLALRLTRPKLAAATTHEALAGNHNKKPETPDALATPETTKAEQSKDSKNK